MRRLQPHRLHVRTRRRGDPVTAHPIDTEALRERAAHVYRHGGPANAIESLAANVPAILDRLAAAEHRTYLAAQRAEEVRAWAVQQYPSGTPLDQDRRMVAAETEAYLSGRSERDMSELAQAAKHAGPVDPPAQEPTDAEVEAAARGLHAALEAVHGTAWDDLGKAHRNRWYDLARAALTAASAARRGESDDSNHPG